MTVYNINLGIGWASSGVEYAQAYRSSIFRNRQIPAKFIFTDMFPQDNLADLTRNLGFVDEDIIWLYTFFTDQKVAPVSFSLDDLIASIAYPITRQEQGQGILRLHCEGQDLFYTVYLAKGSQDLVHRVELVSKGKLIRKDYYQASKVFSEYFRPLDGRATLYQRRFFNSDGSTAYEEFFRGGQSVFHFDKGLYFSKPELIGKMMDDLALTSQDLVILDRATDTGQAVFSHVKPAKLAVVVHAEHYSQNQTTDQTILWNNYYEYEFSHADKVDVFITATDKQAQLMAQQFERYTPYRPRIVTIPVGSIDQLQKPAHTRQPYSLITASRLATEKHVDWLVKAVIALHQDLPELTLDIYGKGGEEDKLRRIIEQAKASDYIRLMGHQDLTKVYQDYQLYVSASKSEGFGLTLLEAIGSGLGMIGFDVPYGNQTFIDPGRNGYRIPVAATDDEAAIVTAFAQTIKAYYAQDQVAAFQERSYEIAQGYLTSLVEEDWQALVEEMTRD